MSYKKISLIIPAYNQEKGIYKDLQNILKVLKKLQFEYEIIVVVDGFSDNTFSEAKKIRDPKVKVVGYKTNRGKGYAVRYGMVRSTGDVIAFKDAGDDLKSDSLPLMLAQFEFEDADILIGSKRHPNSQVKYPFYRKVLSWGYQLLIRVMFGLKVKDTQVGLKIYKKKVLEDVMPRLLVKKFAFDIEMLAVARRLGYSKIYEAPVELDFTGVSSITSSNFWLVIFRTLQDTLAVFYRLKILKYYDDDNKRKWKFDPELNFRINIG
ncbi:glycosyltransferase [Patescibacteria group bacterium]